MNSNSYSTNFTKTRGRVAWAFYDWAGQAFHTLIVTFVFATYFSQGIVGDDLRGQELWGTAASITALIVVFLAPVIGAITDAGGRRKPWIMIFTLIAAISCALLWWAEPNTAFILWALVWFIIAGIAFEICQVFANAMLPDITPSDRIGRWSGWGWAMGYAGGLISIALALVFFVQADSPFLNLDKSNAEHIRIVGPFAALWLLVFSIPLFLWTPDNKSKAIDLKSQIKIGFRDLFKTLKMIRSQINILKFLIARMLYTDGLTTIFVFGGIFAAGVFGMALEEILLFGIVLNLTAGIGSLLFSWVDDYIGPKKTILIAIIGLLITITGALLVESKFGFWIFGSCLGFFVGPAQSSSRSLMSKLSPPDKLTEFFGLYALTGKATAFLGPALVTILTALTQSQRWGLSVLVVFFIGGGALLLTVKEPNANH